MNLRQLEVFQAVMQTGNMSAAARLICITPSAVSKTIAHTELQLGYKLFTRGKGTLAPTPEARVLFEESTLIHQKLDGRFAPARARPAWSAPQSRARRPVSRGWMLFACHVSQGYEGMESIQLGAQEAERGGAVCTAI